MKLNKGNRRAISPVIATVILIAITLIAAVAIAGFVFGLFSGFTSNAQVTQGASSISAGGLGGGTAGLTATCANATGSGSYIALSNTGTAATTVTGLSIVLGGSTFAATVASCTTVPVAASSVIYLQITGNTGTTLAAGSQYTGTVTLANSGQVPLAGTLAP